MFCHNCGTKLDEGSLFCPECGARQLDTAAQNTSGNSDAATPPQYAGSITEEAPYKEPVSDIQSKKDNRLILIIIIVIVLGIITGIGLFFFSGRSSSSGKMNSDTQTSKSVTDSNKKPDAQSAKETKDEGEDNKDEKAAKDEDGNSKSSKDEEEDNKDSDKEDSKSAKDEKEGEDNKGSDKEDSKSAKGENKDKNDADKENDTKKPAEKVYTHEYTVIQGMQTWTDAKAYCEAQGGHLATAVNQAEYDQIVAKANATGCLVLWLGAQRSSDGTFQWVTGEEFAYNAWAPGEPNNDGGSENYLGMMKVNGVWSMYDMPGDVSQYYSYNKVGFVMEKDIEQ